MKCPKCGFDNRRVSKFCSECGAALAASGTAPVPPRSTAGAGSGAASDRGISTSRPSPRMDSTESFWKPDWRWHLRVLVTIYISLVVIYFALSRFLSKVPEPYRMRDIPKEMTPWLKR